MRNLSQGVERVLERNISVVVLTKWTMEREMSPRLNLRDSKQEGENSNNHLWNSTCAWSKHKRKTSRPKTKLEKTHKLWPKGILEGQNKRSNNPLPKRPKVWKKNQLKNLGCYNTYPLRKNLVPEISADPQIGVGVLSKGNLPFPTLPRPLCDYSTEPWEI